MSKRKIEIVSKGKVDRIVFSPEPGEEIPVEDGIIFSEIPTPNWGTGDPGQGWLEGEEIPHTEIMQKSLLVQFQEFIKNDSDIKNLERLVNVYRKELDKIRDRDLGMCCMIYEKDGQIVVDKVDLSQDGNHIFFVNKLILLGQERVKLIELNAARFNDLKAQAV